MNKFTLTFFAVAAAVGAQAQANGWKVENLWQNNTGTFSYSGTFPQVTMSITNQNNTANNTYGERFVAWVSADGGATKAKIDGHKDFSLFFTMKLSTDVNASRSVEGGLLMQYDNFRGYTPESQFYAKFNPGGTPPPTVTTSGDWMMPFWNFVQMNGATFVNGETVLVGLEYDYNDAVPEDSMQRLSFKTHQSPWLNGSWGGAVYDPQMKLGVYFQPLVEPGNPTHSSQAEINLIGFTGTIIGAPETKGAASYVVTDGFEISGGLASLATSDDNRLTLFPDEVSLVSRVEITSQVTTVTNPTEIKVTFEHSAARQGLAVQFGLKNKNTNNFDPIYGGVAPTVDQTNEFITANTAYLQNAGNVVLSARWSPINDEDPAQDGWPHMLDFVSFRFTP